MSATDFSLPRFRLHVFLRLVKPTCKADLWEQSMSYVALKSIRLFLPRMLVCNSVPRVMSKNIGMHFFCYHYSQSNRNHRLVLSALLPIGSIDRSMLSIFQLFEYFTSFSVFLLKISPKISMIYKKKSHNFMFRGKKAG